MTTILDIDLPVDLNTMDETGLPWTFLDEAVDPSRIVPGRHVVVGSGAARAVAVIVDITDEGIVHVCPVPGSVASNAHLLGHRSTRTGETVPDSDLLADFLADDAGQGGIGGDRRGRAEPQDPPNHRRSGAGRDEPEQGATAS